MKKRVRPDALTQPSPTGRGCKHKKTATWVAVLHLPTLRDSRRYPAAPSHRCSAASQCSPGSAYARRVRPGGQVFGRQRDRKLRRRTNLVRGQGKHIRYAIHHDTYHALAQIQNDHHGVVVVVNVALVNFTRRSTIGTMTPRRLVTPLIKAGVLAMRVTWS